MDFISSHHASDFSQALGKDCTFQRRMFVQRSENSSRPSFPLLSKSTVATIERHTSRLNPSNSNSVNKISNVISTKREEEETFDSLILNLTQDCITITNETMDRHVKRQK